MAIIEVKKESAFYEEAIVFLTEKYDKKNRGRKFWINRFNKSESNRIGFLLEIDSKLVGFLGFIESNNMIGLSVWFVEKSYRKNSISFLSEVMNVISKNKIINSSPNPIALKIFHKLYRFNLDCEFIGLPKNIFSFPNSYSPKLYFGDRINVCYDNNISILGLIFFTIRFKKLCVALSNDKKKLLINKKINVLSKNIKYSFPLSIYGDIYE